MDLLQFVDQVSEDLKMALEKPNRNRRKGGGKRAVTAATGASGQHGKTGDGRVSKGKSLQRNYACQQKVLDALFNPKVLHPTADEDEDLQSEVKKSSLPSLRTRRLPPSFFKGPNRRAPNNQDLASGPPDSSMMHSYSCYPPDFTGSTYTNQHQFAACVAPYQQGGPCQVNHHSYDQNLQCYYLQNVQPSLEVQAEGWTSEHCATYSDAPLHQSDTYLTRADVNNFQRRSQYEASWDRHAASPAGYSTCPYAVVESPISVDSRGYGSTVDDYTPSPVASFPTDFPGALANDASVKMMENSNNLDVCIDDFYGVAHTYSSTSDSSSFQLSPEQTMIPAADSEVMEAADDCLNFVNSFQTASPVDKASPLPEFSYAFRGLCSG